MIIKTDPDEIRKYLSDESGFKGYCDNVCFPENEMDILEVLKQTIKTELGLEKAVFFYPPNSSLGDLSLACFEYLKLFLLLQMYHQ